MTYRSTVSLPATRGEFINDSLVVLTRPSGSWQGVDTLGRREDALLPLGGGKGWGIGLDDEEPLTVMHRSRSAVPHNRLIFTPPSRFFLFPCLSSL